MQARWFGLIFLVGDVLASHDEFLDLEALMQMDVQVTTALKRASAVQETPSSIYVLDSKELRSFGVQSVPEALKLVPGVFVRQIDRNVWAITTRFRASQFYSRMLVMVDGQNIYNPTFAGITWEELDIDIASIERIEVIRGTGGMLWGANATNGVVNIITKHSYDTQGIQGHASLDSRVGGEVSVRYGGEYSDATQYRIGIKGRRHEHSDVPFDAKDSASVYSLNFRLDHLINDSLDWQVHGLYVDSDIDQLVQTSSLGVKHTPETVDGNRVSLMTRLAHQISPTASQQFQISYQYSHRPQLAIDLEYQSWDIDYQLNRSWDRSRLDFGTYARYNDLLSEDGLLVKVSENDKNLDIYGMFLQYELDLAERTRLLLAGKVEHNNYHGWGFQPSIRGLHHFNDAHSVWFGYTEVERTPTFAEYAADIYAGLQDFSNIYTTGFSDIDDYSVNSWIRSNNKLDAERSTNYEVGYRFSPTPNTYLDLSGYLSKVENTNDFSIEVDTDLVQRALILASIGDISGAQAIIDTLSIDFQSIGGGSTDIYGVEAVFSQALNKHWRFQTSLTWLDIEFKGQTSNILAGGTSDDILQSKTKLTYLSGQKLDLSAVFNYESESLLYETDELYSLSLGGVYRLNEHIDLSLFYKNIFANEVEYEISSDIYIEPSKQEPYLLGTISIGY